MDETPPVTPPPRDVVWLLRAAAASIATVGVAVAWVLYTSMTEYGSHALAPLLVVAAAVCAVSFARTTGDPVALRRIALVTLALTAIPWTTQWPGGLRAHWFGGSVVGLCPLLALDVTFDATGRMRFRDKTHLVTWSEVAPLAQGADVVIVSDGWNDAVIVRDEVRRALGARLIVLRSPDAVARWRALRARGVRASLLLHTTC